ncbi:hypothetical protein J6590_082690 [Homalodisca vitripennis]|nr:hypothetical protein J6590_082690 [Homalodisca vitripennis]
MVLLVEQSKSGKPLILYNNYKYRESHCLKNGERAWRCLGGKCGATVRTNAEATQLVSSSGKHHGPHPVTMRTLSLSPPPNRSMVSSAAPVCASTPVSSLVQSAVTSVPSNRAETSAPAACVSATVASLERDAATPVVSPGTARCLSAMEMADLVAENQQLKHRLLQLEEQYKHVLDHSIESDTRLMQYTNQVFVAATSLVESPVRASVADCAVQCDPPLRASVADCAMQCELPTDCGDQRCADTRDLVAGLKTTIEVLEAELNSLREKGSSGCTREQPSEWSVVSDKRRHLPTKTNNKYQVLSSLRHASPPSKSPAMHRSPKEDRKNEKKKNKNNHKTNLPLSSIFIEGDSHVRGLVGHVRRKVARRTKVNGLCKPGAKLLEATSDVPPPGSCCVIVAGTNDVASGQQCNVYRHLEQRIVTRLLTSGVVVSTLPHRHDLPPCHQINQEVALLNAYIEELCARYRGAVVLDFNQISRSAFTSHGMHLKQSSKHLLADLLIDCLRRLNRSNPRTSSRIPVTAAEPLPTRPQRSSTTPMPTTLELPVAAYPHVLPYDSFAEALKSGSSIRKPDSTFINAMNQQKNCPPFSCVNLT